MGVPSVTTNLSGFGCFIADFVPDPEDYGIFLVNRKTFSVEESVEQLTVFLHRFTQQTHTERGLQRRKTEKLRKILDWKTLGIAYVKARSAALQTDRPPSDEKPTKKSLIQRISPRGKSSLITK